MYNIFRKCSACNRRKLYISDKWVYSPFMHMKIRPKKLLCSKCIKLVASIK